MTQTMKSPLSSLDKLAPQMEGWKVVADMSTAHLPMSDRDILNGDIVPTLIGSYDYGWFVNACVPEDQVETLRRAGFSEAYINILTTLRNRKVYYICFDCDAPVWPDFPTHERL